MTPANHYARQVNPRNVALQRIGIQSRLARNRIEMHSQALNELKVGVVSGQGEYLLRGEPLFTSVIADDYFLRSDLLHSRLKKRLNLPGLDPVFDVGLHPILDALPE